MLVWISVFALVALGAVVFRLLASSGGLSVPSGEHAATVWELRGLRASVGAVVGVGLAVSGVLLQSLFRNPLASPDLLGMSAGAGLAVLIVAMVTHTTGGSAAMGRGPAALAGSFAALGLLYALGQRRGMIDPVSMILVGVIVSVLCGSVMGLLQQLLPRQAGAGASRWLLGRIDEDVRWIEVGVWGAVTLAGAAWAWWLGRAMDVASLGEQEAKAAGVALDRVRLVQFLLAGVLAAGAVSLAGPLGFVGLVCPHAVRLTAGPGHRGLVVGAAFAGVALVVGADGALKLLPMATGRVPLGLVTALVGGPVFLWMLLGSRGRG